MAHNSIPSHEPSSVALALEKAIALAVSRANAIVADGTADSNGLAAADPDELADALTVANTLLGKLDDIRHGIALARRQTETETDEQTARPDVVTAIDILHDVRALVQMVYYAGEQEQNECIAATANLIHDKLRAVLDALGERP